MPRWLSLPPRRSQCIPLSSLTSRRWSRCQRLDKLSTRPESDQLPLRSYRDISASTPWWLRSPRHSKSISNSPPLPFPSLNVRVPSNRKPKQCQSAWLLELRWQNSKHYDQLHGCTRRWLHQSPPWRQRFPNSVLRYVCEVEEFVEVSLPGERIEVFMMVVGVCVSLVHGRHLGDARWREEYGSKLSGWLGSYPPFI